MSLQQVSQKSHASVSSALAYAALLTSMLYLLFFHLSVDAPVRSGGHRPAGMESAENIQNAIVATMQRAAQDKNLQLHFQSPDGLGPNAAFFVTVYFRASYEFYPLRVFVGNDDRVINSPGELQTSNQLPTNDWLHQHDVSSVFCFLPGDGRGPGMLVNRVP